MYGNRYPTGFKQKDKNPRRSTSSNYNSTFSNSRRNDNPIRIDKEKIEENFNIAFTKGIVDEAEFVIGTNVFRITVQRVPFEIRLNDLDEKSGRLLLTFSYQVKHSTNGTELLKYIMLEREKQNLQFLHIVPHGQELESYINNLFEDIDIIIRSFERLILEIKEEVPKIRSVKDNLTTLMNSNVPSEKNKNEINFLKTYVNFLDFVNNRTGTITHDERTAMFKHESMLAKKEREQQNAEVNALLEEAVNSHEGR